MAAVAEMLRRFRLEQYIAAFDDAGYDDLVYLRSMDDAMVDRLVADVGMKVGHAARFRFYLQEERARLRAGGAEALVMRSMMRRRAEADWEITGRETE